MNPLSIAIALVGVGDLANQLGISYQAVRKWELAKRLPRTEWTGETSYAEKIELATKGVVTKSALLTLPWVDVDVEA